MSLGTKDINPIVLIPACMTSNRLPNKPMMDIGGAPMIVQVWRRAMEADIGPVLVAADSHEIAQAIRDAGGDAVVTNPAHPSGSDRICEALDHFDPNHRFNIVVDLQGDLPTIDPTIIRSVLVPLADEAVDIATLAVEITEEDQKNNPNVVKVVGAEVAPKRLKALYFTRATAPHGDGTLYHHIGLYAYRRNVLETFSELPVSQLEDREHLEQLRAIEAGMRIDVAIVDDFPFGVDTMDDVEKARAIIANRAI
ncbi:3-deoxy-manno-octulosonate cytidylyltransferase (CMP-KDO synthetase) [Cohaesibacter sp. ES.047]|uniref:3-deoxy-manno-octulosonate cytidylyltransferase n=1 Tax=Cohaesibacter sp. ES.047 TaxID=1798205 RepID=UPI000BB8F154|nr:3-deoxy-manno-octulosonate cytidylyltransferase [Cohaesibacter sp. ES.047]SNY91842.1 3-deoxy-manno-octulosonate cytidylyltransferase (CMP-KDO synthetase) [Cohaesibacter sp. ES.047]